MCSIGYHKLILLSMRSPVEFDTSFDTFAPSKVPVEYQMSITDYCRKSLLLNNLPA